MQELDFTVRFTKGSDNDQNLILIIIDTFSRWAEMFWRKDANAESAADCLLAHFGRFGSPNMIRSDR